ncbi:Maltose/maltodextrin import ATP-binding protein MalK [bioreactor metagenome]|uniref:Maltose/maltodextrin import ATP-binding protein MalK n=1 Tax=bioreactor metagenome TaxID=1076179 RepID=A0A645DM62_9ZZZZ
MAIVAMKDITVQYGKNIVIDSLSLEVEQGETLAIVGPSSCGKTTLMRALCGFIKISKGTISIKNTIVSSPAARVMVPPEDRRIGVVFQDYAVWPHLTVIENILYPLKKLGYIHLLFRQKSCRGGDVNERRVLMGCKPERSVFVGHHALVTVGHHHVGQDAILVGYRPLYDCRRITCRQVGGKDEQDR